MKVAVFSTQPYERPYLDKANIGHKHQLTYFETSLNAQTCHLAEGFEAVCVFVSDKIDKDVIGKLLKIGIKLIDLRCAGFNNVDVEAAKSAGIKILRVPAYSPQAVAEQAVAMILTLNRKTHKAYNRVREGNFSLAGLMGFNLYGKTVGIIGTGKIGRAFANIMLGFGCKVIANDIKESDEMKVKGVEYLHFEKLLECADIISLHCPLTPQTTHLFDDVAFSKIQKNTMLINTSRGGLIKTTHAIDALKSGQLGYLGIDVYEQEQDLFFKDLSGTVIQDDTIERLMSFNNVLITPHQAFFTHEALEQIATTTIRNFTNFEDSLPSDNEVR